MKTLEDINQDIDAILMANPGLIGISDLIFELASLIYQGALFLNDVCSREFYTSKEQLPQTNPAKRIFQRTHELKVAAEEENLSVDEQEALSRLIINIGLSTMKE